MQRSRIHGRRALAAATWLLPAVLLVVSGLAKALAPVGTPPQSLEWLTRSLSYPLLLRLLGGFEILVAVQMLRPSTRRLGVGVAIGLFAGFTLMVASNAHDAEFLADCGCFGGLPLRSVWSGLGPILLRNALLCGLLAAALGLSGSTRQRTWLTVAQAAGLGALVLFVAAYVAERRLRADDRLTVEVARSGEQITRFPGVELPEIELVAADGTRTTSRRALRDHDHLMFFSPGCPHCRVRAPQWAEFDRELAGRGARLVLLAIDELTPIEEFKSAHGCEGIVHYVVPSRFDPHRWGVEALPQLVVLGRDQRMVFHEGQILGETFSASLATASRRVDGLARAGWDRIAEALFGAGATCVEPPVRRGDLMLAAVRTPQGETMRMGVGAASGIPTYAIELALGLDGDGMVRDAIPLTLSGYARVVDPDGRLYDKLRGKSLAEAVQLAEAGAARPSMEAPVWDAVGLLLGALADELAPAPTARQASE